jgi:hypothetical protein
VCWPAIPGTRSRTNSNTSGDLSREYPWQFLPDKGTNKAVDPQIAQMNADFKTGFSVLVFEICVHLCNLRITLLNSVHTELYGTFAFCEM